MDTGGDVSLELRRIPYDIQKIATAMRASFQTDWPWTSSRSGGGSYSGHHTLNRTGQFDNQHTRPYSCE